MLYLKKQVPCNWEYSVDFKERKGQEYGIEMKETQFVNSLLSVSADTEQGQSIMYVSPNI